MTKRKGIELPCMANPPEVIFRMAHTARICEATRCIYAREIREIETICDEQIEECTMYDVVAFLS